MKSLHSLSALWLVLTTVRLSGATAETQPPSPPNILFAIADDWGAHAGAYGTKWVRTPHFDRVAREGILFRNAYTPNAKCAPSRACILTGRNSWQLKEAANHLCFFPPEFKSWGEALAEHGWSVGHTTKGWGPGVAKDSEGRPRQMTGKAFNQRKAPAPTSGIGPSDYAANFEDFLETVSPGKPWAFWYGAIEPHRGYEFGSGVKKGGYRLDSIEKVPAFWPDTETVRNDMLDYAFEVEHFDRHLGRMLESLEKRGLLANTLVVVTSDHGMPFPRGKGSDYEFSNHVPLAVMWPAGVKGRNRVVDDYVSFVDIAPTILEVAGLSREQTRMAEFAGRSLIEIFRAKGSGQVVAARNFVLLGMERHDIGRPQDAGYPVRALLKAGTLYLENYEPSRWPACNPETGYLNVDASPTKSLILAEHRKNAADPFWALCFGKRPPAEMYDLKTDPDCVKNLAASPAQEQLRSGLRGELHAKLRAEGDPRMFGQGAVFDQYPHSNPANAGFYERFMRGEILKTPWVENGDFEPHPLD